MKIQVLPPEVSDQIAAGEVVERPASAVKELVENAIDAGATEILVKFENGGKTFLEISDNGAGMSPDDAEKSVQRHATSKIGKIDDIFAIRTFGFRGEALAAISSVSNFELVTRTANETSGTKIEISAGKNLKKSLAPANIGTKISVRNLFFPTPARLAHLKTDATESAAIVHEIESFALSHPAINFGVERDGKKILDLPASDRKIRAAKILKENSDDLILVNKKIGDVKISGFVIAPGLCARTKKSQWLSVNGRRIEDWRLAHAIRESYQQSAGIEKHLFPKFAISIELDPLLVDVNVHPRKLEVKFSEPGEIWRAMKNAILFSLEKSVSVSANSTFSNPNFSRPNFAPSQNFGTKNWNPNSAPGQTFWEKSNASGTRFSEKNEHRDFEISAEKTPEKISGELRLIGQVAKKYVVAEDENGIWFFDQHALHERERFENFWNARHELSKKIQKLLLPHELNLDEPDLEKILTHRDELKNLGFEISDRGIVISVPALLASENLDAIFQDFSEFFEGEKVAENFTDKFLRKMLEYKSCRGAVMFGDKLERAEMQKLLDDFAKTQWRNLCPHGRPNHWFVPFDELDEKFHR
ncbi:DNA mismatch repair endonuclease MutL [bacterium]|jgi:DNA mismatch repair protein MutL|nr:DNA mismatch repair endonuclease MutL [bacterium]MBT6832207.1 DNA mismatch repair endonuclease MutL [bacterium]MBT6996152.1 DNA mismatch repair endonuclease MutL [bacterium]MBT7772232.1 DNA mismatch repair endonuclease MutL [bacterium]